MPSKICTAVQSTTQFLARTNLHRLYSAIVYNNGTSSASLGKQQQRYKVATQSCSSSAPDDAFYLRTALQTHLLKFRNTMEIGKEKARALLFPPEPRSSSEHWTCTVLALQGFLKEQHTVPFVGELTWPNQWAGSHGNHCKPSSHSKHCYSDALKWKWNPNRKRLESVPNSGRITCSWGWKSNFQKQTG